MSIELLCRERLDVNIVETLGNDELKNNDELGIVIAVLSRKRLDVIIVETLGNDELKNNDELGIVLCMVDVKD